MEDTHSQYLPRGRGLAGGQSVLMMGWRVTESKAPWVITAPRDHFSAEFLPRFHSWLALRRSRSWGGGAS